MRLTSTTARWRCATTPAAHPTPAPTFPRRAVSRTSRTRHPDRLLAGLWLRSAGLAGAGLAAAVTAGFAVAFHLPGFTRPPQPDSYWIRLLYAFRAILSLTDSEIS
jgi:hypothetical protein